MKTIKYCIAVILIRAGLLASIEMYTSDKIMKLNWRPFPYPHIVFDFAEDWGDVPPFSTDISEQYDVLVFMRSVDNASLLESIALFILQRDYLR